MKRLVIALAMLIGTLPAWSEDQPPAPAPPAPRPAVHRLAPRPAVQHAATPAPAPVISPAQGNAKLSQAQVLKNPVLVLQQFSAQDLQAALADAQAQTPPDTIAANCYQALINVLQNPIANPLPQGPGLFQLLQKGRDLKNGIASLQANNGPLTPLAIGCAPLILDGQNTLIQLGILSGAVVGAGLFGIPPLGSLEQPPSWLAYQQVRDRLIALSAE
jgi:hypothetical protein